ncbi:hypothetical protein SARC_05855 [Sphaeroforma arctica JP610]|uniref:Uncharacterized protein n=1 Tax=Sphaeroforma arctica JP610 TaxID=667725 RepID=A0A0L0FYC5_9EUKA|nr:hypothetical protein SARC_05855 [Sphaeroforma arctica JP610]KNC81835.1 hypothetical protein SARC_05855 [Sphaeroforma arctica JP610]|eukprot:XP_014155737.1 hypothetical protein SARC_05855 [Sphaeroforma arctica JP610]
MVTSDGHAIREQVSILGNNVGGTSSSLGPPSGDPRLRPPMEQTPRPTLSRAADGADETPACIPESKRKHHGLWYESLDSDNQNLTSETGSLRDFAHQEVRAKGNPHGKEALENLYDRLHTKDRKQQRRKIFVHEAVHEAPTKKGTPSQVRNPHAPRACPLKPQRTRFGKGEDATAVARVR